jgi:3',5'-cyclic AMP phosphodiesterase CpdA
MRTIAHISDLHFGTEIPEVVEALLEDINSLKPSIVIASGDLTQRAKSEQYMQAADFLKKLDFPKIVIPGNHDISLYNLVRRFFQPLKRFRRYIHDEPVPYYIDKEIAVMGINSAHSLTFKSGRITDEQIQLIRDKLCHLAPGVNKVLVVHHNIIQTPGKTSQDIIEKAEQLWEEIDVCDIDLILAGHVHTAYTAFIKASNPESGTAVLASAGTAFSSRKRGEPNSYNFIVFDGNHMTITRKDFTGKTFTDSVSVSYKKHETIWYQQIK